MADATNYAKAIAPAVGTYLGPEYDGRVIAEWDYYTLPSSSPIGTVVNVGILRPGETYLFGAVSIPGTLGSGTTLQLGDAGDDDRYMAAIASTSALLLWAARAGASLGMGYKNSTLVDIPIVLKLAGGEGSAVRIDTFILKLRA